MTPSEQLFEDIEALVDGAVVREDITIQQGADISQALWCSLRESESRPQSQGVPTGEGETVHDVARALVRQAWDGASPKDALLRLSRYIDQQEACEAAQAAYERDRSQAAGDGWVKTHALPSWMHGLYWVQLADGSVPRHPAVRVNGRWNFTAERRVEDTVVALCPALPPPAPPLPAPPSDSAEGGDK